MSEYTSSNITVTVPDSNQSANMITAFQNYHDDIAPVISGKELVITGAATSVISSNLTANSVLVANATGKISTSYGIGITTSNLSVLDGLTSQSEILFPPGMLASYSGFTVPDGWLFCNGATILKSSYPNLVDILTLKAPITSIEINGDNETGDWEVFFGISPITLPSYSYWSLSLTANAAVRAATRLAEVPGFPASETLFSMGLQNDTISSSLAWYGSGQATISETWLNNGTYSVSDLNLTINVYGSPTSLTNMILPDFRNKFIYGSNDMNAITIASVQQEHNHSFTNSYAQIERDGNFLLLKEQEVGNSWTMTEKVSGSSNSINTTTRTSGVAVVGGPDDQPHMPPYITAKYIIKT